MSISIHLLSNIYDDSTGKISIGTSLPINNSLLSVNGPISINGVIYNSYATGKSLPSTGTIGIGSSSDGTKIVLYPGSSDVYPFAFGIGTSTLWYSVPNENTHNWYIGGTSYMNLSSFSLIVNTSIISSLKGSINNNTYTWYNNTNTGLYQPDTNTIGFSAAANNVMTIGPSNIIMSSNIIFTSNSIFQGGPIKSLTGGIDDKIILASSTNFNNQPDYPFSIGYSSSNIWTSIPSWGSNTFYVGGSSLMNITSNQLSINGKLILNGINIVETIGNSTGSSTDLNTVSTFTSNYISSNTLIQQNYISSNSIILQQFINSNSVALITSNYISSNALIQQNYISSNSIIQQNYISSNALIQQNYISSNSIILQQFINSNSVALITSNYISSNALIQQNYISSNSIIQQNYISSNALIQQNYISSNTLIQQNYISSNALIQQNYISSNALIQQNYISSNTLIQQQFINSNSIALITSNYISSNTLIQQNYISSNALIQQNYISSNSIIQQNYISSNSLIQQRFINSNSVALITSNYISSNVFNQLISTLNNTVNTKLITVGAGIGTTNSTPGLGTYGTLTDGTRIVLNTGSLSVHPYAVGIGNSSLWNSVPTNSAYDWYVGGSSYTTLSSTKMQINTNYGLGINSPVSTTLAISDTYCTGGYINGINAGDINVYSYWGVAINLNAGGNNPSGVATQSRIPSTSSFTINKKSNGETTYSTLFTVLQSGNVGIGKTNPGSLLDVNGALNVSGVTSHQIGSYIAPSINFGTSGIGLYGISTTGVGISGDLTLSGTIYNNSINLTGTNPCVSLGVNDSGNLGYASAGGNFSGSAITGDLVLRSASTNNLLLQSGSGSSAIYINTANNVGIRTNNPANILQVGSGGRLRIANSISDYTLIGTNDTDGSTNTRIVISGNTRSSYSGNIEYVATSTGNHIFYANGAASSIMILNSSGQVGIGTTTNLTTGALLSVNSVINITNTARIGAPTVGTIGDNTATDGTKIVLYPGISGYPFAFGIDSYILWYSVPSACSHKWYIGGTSYMNLTSTSLNVNTNIISSIQGTTTNNTFTWYNNTNTGLYQPATNNIGFSAAGNNIMTISPSNIIMNSNIIFADDAIFQGGPIKSLTGGIDDKIILAAAKTFNNQADYPFSIGYSSSNLWTSIPSWGSNIFYVGGSSVMNISSNQVSVQGELILKNTNISNIIQSYVSTISSIQSSIINLNSISSFTSNYISSNSLANNITNLINIIGNSTNLNTVSSFTSNYISSNSLIQQQFINSNSVALITSNYISSNALNLILNSYISSNSLASVVSSYVSSNINVMILSSYVTSNVENLICGNYISSNALIQQNFISSNSLANIVSAYVSSNIDKMVLSSYVTSNVENLIDGNYISSNALIQQQFINSNSVTLITSNYISSNVFKQLISTLNNNINTNLITVGAGIGTTSSTPGLGTYGTLTDGTRIVLNSGSSSVYPYALGIGNSSLWHSVPSSSTQDWYVGGTNWMNLSSTVFQTRTPYGILINPASSITLVNSDTNSLNTYINNIVSGDTNIYSYWGVSINLNAAGANPSGNATQSRLVNTSSFTINQKSGIGSTYSTLFTVLQSGNVGIGTTDPGAKLVVNGTLNVSGVTSHQLGTSAAPAINFGTSGIGIYGDSSTGVGITGNLTISGKVGIGKTNPVSTFHINQSAYAANTPCLVLNCGGANGTLPRGIGTPMLQIGEEGYSSTAGDYYGIGFGYSPYLGVSGNYVCCEIGTLITDKTAGEIGDIVLSTRSTNVASTVASERMRITSAGNVGIGKTNPGTLLDVNGTLNVSGVTSHQLGSSSIPAINFGTSAIGIYGNSSTGVGIAGNLTTGQIISIVGPPGNAPYITIAANGQSYGQTCLGNALVAGNFSNWAAVYDTVLRSDANKALILQSGSGGGGIYISSTNNVGIGTSTLTTGASLSVNGIIYTPKASGVSVPSIGTIGDGTSADGTKIVLYPGTATTHPHAIGISNYTLWYSVPTVCNHNWYVGGTSYMNLNSTLLNVTNGIGIGTNSLAANCLLQVYSNNNTFNNYTYLNAHSSREVGIGLIHNSGNSWYIFNRGTGFVGYNDNLSISSTNSSCIIEVTQSGKVGIGTTANLAVNNSVLTVYSATPAISIVGGGTTSALNLATYETTNAYNCSLIATDDSNFGASFQIKQKTPGAITNGQFTSFYINSSGQVGIGTTSNLAVNNSVLTVYSATPAISIVSGTGGAGATSILNFSTYPTTNAYNCSLITTDDGNFGATFQIKQKTNGAITNTQFTSFYINSSGKVGIATNNPTGILQVGNGERLRIGNDITDYTLIGTSDTGGTANTRIVISGNTRSGGSGNIEYVATSTGSHIFYSGGSSTSMIINSSGKVGIATNNPTSIFQVGTGGKLKISNDINDCTLIGTIDTDGNTNTRIVISGNTRSGYSGNIEYFATSTGSHIFNSGGSSTSMIINSSGQIGIGTTTLTTGASLSINGLIYNPSTTGVSAPSTGTIGSGTSTDGTKIVLYKAPSSSEYPYALGINSYTLWYSVPASSTHNWYVGGTSYMNLSSSILNINSQYGLSFANIAFNTTLATADLNCTNSYINALAAGDLNMYSYWGVSINLGSGGAGTASATNTRINQTIAFTVNKKVSNSYSTLFTVLQSGNVGIGKTNPGTLLDVNGSITCVDAITINGTNSFVSLVPSGQTGGAGLGNASTAAAFSSWAATNDTILRSATSKSLILQSGSGGAAIYINSTNDVGIGTNNPGTKLVVNGPIYTQSSTAAAPGVGIYGSGTDGTRIILYQGSVTTHPYAIGYDTSTLWYSVPSGGNHKWFSNGISFMNLTSTGLLSVYDDIIGFSAYSDKRLKENIKPLDINCIDLINKIKPVEFTWKNVDKVVERKRNVIDYGFIAQEVEELLPHLVQEVDSYKTIKYEKMVPYLVKALQEQTKIIEELKERIIALENK